MQRKNKLKHSNIVCVTLLKKFHVSQNATCSWALPQDFAAIYTALAWFADVALPPTAAASSSGQLTGPGRAGCALCVCALSCSLSIPSTLG